MGLSIFLQNLQFCRFIAMFSVFLLLLLMKGCEKTAYSLCAAVGGGPGPSPALSPPVSVQLESPVANSLRSAAAPPRAALQ